MKNKITGTKEWAERNFNIIRGCCHNCLYCYARGNSTRFKQSSTKSWKDETLRVNVKNVNIPKCSGTIMYPSSHDISPELLDEHIIIIRRLIDAGNSLLIVSKPHIECIQKICQEFSGDKKNILFRFTIGSTDNSVLKFWEPGAPSFDERYECLKLAYKSGFKTSVSAEPMLEGSVDDLITKVSPYVNDAIWLGKPNRLKGILVTNGYNLKEIMTRAEQLIASQDDTAIKVLYKKYKKNPLIKYKESVKEVVGIKLLKKAGLDK